MLRTVKLKRIVVVSFNENERDAVDRLLSDLASGQRSPWHRHGPEAIKRPYGADEWQLEHVALRAQGNVLAASRLAQFFAAHREGPKYVVFYGCAGAIHQRHADSVFLVRDVNYLSLGTVDRSPDHREGVTLKNKWLCHLDPEADVAPLDVVSFPMCRPGSVYDLCQLSGIPSARVAATDKVVRIRPTVAPGSVQHGPPHARYAKAEWSYGEALAFVEKQCDVVIVEMESYGIARIADALNLQDRVVVLRVTTDVLEDHAETEGHQKELLERGRHILGRVLAILFTRPGREP